MLITSKVYTSLYYKWLLPTIVIALSTEIDYALRFGINWTVCVHSLFYMLGSLYELLPFLWPIVNSVNEKPAVSRSKSLKHLNPWRAVKSTLVLSLLVPKKEIQVTLCMRNAVN